MKLKTTKILYTCDLHGSERCYLKATNAVKMLKADVLLISGDLSGKTIIPFTSQRDGSHTANLYGGIKTAKNEKELEDLEKRARAIGAYTYRTTPEEATSIEGDKPKLEALFRKLVLERISDWVKIGEERLRDTGIQCYLMPGNDDMPEISDIIDKSNSIVNPEGKNIKVDEYHEMISLGYSNPTPWKTPREASEEKLAEMIDAMVGTVQNMKNCIFNFHCPPYDTMLDEAPELDKNMRPMMSAGSLLMKKAGSTTIRAAIEKNQPLLGLFGHIHESSAEQKIGRTRCFNPGSEYQNGVLRGYVIELDADQIVGSPRRIEG